MTFIKKVLIVTDYDLYSKSGAAFSRLNCYAKACPDLLFSLYCMSLKYLPGDGYEKLDDNFEIKKGKIRRQSFAYRNFFRLFDFITPYKLIRIIKKEHRADDYNVLLYTSHFLLFLSVLISFRFHKKVKIIVEKNEIEIGIILNQSLPKGFNKIISILIFPVKFLFALFIDLTTYMADGIIAISGNLKKLYRFHENLVRVPVLVDIERFKPEINKLQGTNFLYIGAVTKKKDGLFKLIKVLGTIRQEIPKDASFLFVGTGSRAVLQDFSALVEKNGLDSLVKIKTEVPSHQIPEIIKKYQFGLLLRGNNLQTKYGFSTKLAEYLAAGLPVITTPVSDNGLFLSNNFDSVIVNFSEKSLAEALISCFNMNDAVYQEMSNAAMSAANSRFHYSNYRSELVNMLK
jgi:glycosyltransferase involved in cell wall biosynthesis